MSSKPRTATCSGISIRRSDSSCTTPIAAPSFTQTTDQMTDPLAHPGLVVDEDARSSVHGTVVLQIGRGLDGSVDQADDLNAHLREIDHLVDDRVVVVVRKGVGHECDAASATRPGRPPRPQYTDRGEQRDTASHLATGRGGSSPERRVLAAQP